jgi:rhomboid family GlyGly-CTERM serine protease
MSAVSVMASPPPRPRAGAAFAVPPTGNPAGGLFRRPETWGCLALLALCNTPGNWAAGPDRWGFHWGALAAGEVWRVFTHAFTHGSAYHLGLDAAAFLGLVGLLESRQTWVRSTQILACLLGALAGAAWAGPPELGYAGLSGAAHGLMALVCARRAREGDTALRWALVLLLAKCTAEMLLGGAVLTAWHPGDVGTPVVAGHAGGVLLGTLLGAWPGRAHGGRMPHPFEGFIRLKRTWTHEGQTV